MSAFLCSDKHLNTIVNFVIKNELDKDFYSGNRNTPDALMTMLYNENIKSLNYRYQEKGHEALNLVFKPYEAQEVTATQFLKLLHYYEYQSCEHPEWGDSLANKLVKRWEEQAIKLLPGYQEADWDI